MNWDLEAGRQRPLYTFRCCGIGRALASSLRRDSMQFGHNGIVIAMSHALPLASNERRPMEENDRSPKSQPMILRRMRPTVGIAERL